MNHLIFVHIFGSPGPDRTLTTFVVKVLKLFCSPLSSLFF